ncbi:YqjD family protein [Methylotenera sp.]|jgi:ElaB/YqjD/DUF883 family membrane-anchored ribosome-binding protein|uniref:DUF883 family protein n=1 Tax=Methylotenera sp. TaxID=2051956 RepID=UPI002720B91E|nr:DUF883 family protein [Methylotenera sp.]MDO9205066.1 DUF883 family protein [Methylotenera sp.]MDO9392673.1 DUF883 family protein [Methylotenera sp.]MDP1522029.1 DUF883 family protein [Methylotenera sp.]MDP2070021.1 DUF883 family protein [Methylotenera sp.]MDP2230301.1 DUF883 family protein [Methylotenera sp.]
MEKFADQFNKDHLINEFKVVVADAEALLKATANTGGEKLAEVRARAEESLSIAKARMLDAQAEVLARSKAAAKATDEYVHENPWRSIGLAASVGVVVGLLIGRR